MSSILRVGLMDEFPMTNFNCTRLKTFRITKYCPRPGLAVEVIKLIADQANMTIHPVVFDEGDADENLGKMFEALNSGVIDTVGHLFTETPARREAFALSWPLYTGITQMAVRRADSTSIYDFFAVYSPTVWFCLFFSLLIFMAFGMLVRFTEWQLGMVGMNKQLQIAELIWRILRMQINQNDKLEFKLSSGAFALWTFSLLQCLVLLGVYQSYIISSAVRVRDPKPFEPEELATQLRQGKYSLVSVDNYTWMYEQITGDKIDFFEIRKALEYNPIMFTGSEAEAVKKVNGGGRIMFFDNDELIMHTMSEYCDLVFLDSPFEQQDRHLPFSKKYPHMDKINASIKVQVVYIQRAYRKYAKKHEIDRCRRKGPGPLSITSYEGVIILFLTGTFVGSTAFGLEFLFHTFTKQ